MQIVSKISRILHASVCIVPTHLDPVQKALRMMETRLQLISEYVEAMASGILATFSVIIAIDIFFFGLSISVSVERETGRWINLN